MVAIDSGVTSRYKGRSILYPGPSPKPMSIALLALLCALLYLAATGLQLLHLSQRRQQIDRSIFALGLLALLSHTLIVWKIAFASDGVDLGFFKVAALLFLVINLACITSLTRRPLQNLLIVLFPLSALAVLVSTFAPDYRSGAKSPQRRHDIAHQ